MKPFSGSGGSSPSNAKDSYFTDDVIELVLAISEGPIKGLKGDTAKNFYVGDTPLLNSNGKTNFKDFELDVNVGSDLGELIIPTLGGQASSTTVQSTLSQSIPVVRQGSHVDIDWIEVRLVINQLVHNSDDGAKGRDLDLKIEIKPSSSPTWVPAVLYADMGTTTQKDGSGLKVIQRDDIESAMTAARTQVIWDQTAQPNPTSAERALGGAYGNRVWWIDSVHDDFTPKFYQDNAWFQPDGLTTAGIPGRMSATFEDSNYIALIDPARTDIKRTIFFYETGTPVGPRVGDLWLNPGTTVLLWFNGAAWVSSITAEAGAYDPTAGNKVISPVGWLHLHEKITSNAVREVRIKVDRIGDTYDLRVTKLTADSDSFADDRTDVSWESFQEIKAEPMRFPHLATARLKGRASDQFSSLPTFQGVYEGRTVKVPSNYDPVTRNYTGVWDGTWKQAYTNNPAYIGYDLVENDRYGMSSTYPITLDPFDVFEAGQWCDRKLPSGKPQFTFNMLVKDAQSPRELATYIFGTFGGRFFDDGNGYGRIRLDNGEAPAVHLFTKENVKSGIFKYSYTEIESRINDYTVSFKNPDLFYAEDRRRVYDQPAIDTYGRAPDDFVAVGCNNADEAVYRATVKLLTDQTEIETVTFETAREGLYLEPYEIILVSDDTMDDVITGRIKSTDGAHLIFLRDNVYLEDGFDHEIVINLDQFELATLSIDAASVGRPTKVLKVVEQLPAGIPAQAVFSIGQAAKAYRVLTIGEGGEGDGDQESVTISAIEVNRTKYATAAESPGSVIIEIPEFPTDLSVVSNARITPFTEVRSGRPVQNLRVEWDPHPNKFVRSYSINSRFNDDQWQFNGEVKGPRFELYDVKQGRYIFSIQALALTGQKSVVAYVDIDLSGAVRVVAPIKNLALVNQSGVNGSIHLFDDVHADLAWEPGEEDPALSSYLVKIFNDGEGLLRTTFVGVPSFSYSSSMIRTDAATRQLRVEITAFDIFGNASAPVSMFIKNPAPAAPVVAADRGFGSVSFSWPIAGLIDYAGALLWLSPTPGIDPTSRAPDMDINSNTVSVAVESMSVCYAVVALYDTLGKAELNYSQEVFAQSYQTVDTEPPETPAGLGLSTRLETVDGVVQRMILTAVLGAAADEDFAYFDFEIKQNDGNWVSFTSSTPTFEWTVLPLQTYAVRASAVDQMGNRSPMTAEQSLVTPECPELADLINGGSVSIEAGKIRVQGSTMLSDWRNPGDLTTINGNKLGTGTVTADKAIFGQRGVQVEDIVFDYNNPSANKVSWTSGVVRYTGDDGNTATRTIAAGNATWTTGTLFICYTKNATVLTATTDPLVAFDHDAIVVATYKGDKALDGSYGRTIIDGGQLKTGTVIADQARANSIDANAIQSDAIQSRHVAAGSITADKITVGNGGNWLDNADLSAGLNYWLLGRSSVNVQALIRNDIYAPVGGCLQVAETAASAPADYGYFICADALGAQRYFPVIPGQKYQFSVYAYMLNAPSFGMIRWYDSAGAIVADSGLPNIAAQNGNPNYNLGNYARPFVIAACPAGAVRASVIFGIQAKTTAAGTAAYGFFVRPFFGEATPYQTQPSPWSSGGATAIAGGSIKTNNLAAISADLGDIRAGTVGSPDGKFLITLTQGKLEWFE
ncbi:MULTISPECIES: phage tail protein [unclassified Mesorhizobium]|uniref:phage tail protein n=6 Tax=Mesorhizobium TaxID=68287 RepID=UPI00167B35D4|nr:MULTISPECIES: phage tail protein [unclassified Mesorhizobium]